MHRFYLPPEQCREQTLGLTGREAHHALEVLRVRRGERVVVLDGAGHKVLCEVRQAARQRVALGVVQETSHAPLPGRLTLLQAIPKGKVFEAIVQKATELGAFRIVPLLSERVVSQADWLNPQPSTLNRLEKWRWVAIDSIKQCGSPWLPQIEAPLTPGAFLARSEQFDLPLVASLQGDRRHPREVWRAFQKEQGRMPATVCVWVGPEGDFTSAELAAIKAAGAMSVSLGPLVLRSETAAIYCLSVLNYELHAPELRLAV